MKYLNQKFSVAAPDSDAYRENWDRIFRPEPVIPMSGDYLPEDLPREPCKVHCTCTKYLGRPCCMCGAEPPGEEP